MLVMPQGLHCSNECKFSFTQGSSLLITAQPDLGYRLMEWGGLCKGAKSNCSFVVTDDAIVSVTFEQVSPLTVTKIGEGEVTATGGMECGDDCEQRVDGGMLLVYDGPRLTLKAKPAPGNRFVGWSGSCVGVETSCIITLDQDRSVEARFEPIAGIRDPEAPQSPPP
jgi:hypothetical protein